MVKVKRPIDRSDTWRVLLTDTVPYEVPVIINNRLLHAHLVSGVGGVYDVDFNLLSIEKLKENSSSGKMQWTRPLEYNIDRPNNSPRTLHYPHPVSQIDVCFFYQSYDQIIIQNCATSRYSLRKPVRIAARAVKKEEYVEDEKNTIRPHGEYGDKSDVNQSLYLRSHYVYETTTYYPKFFKSTELNELESRYSRMLELDIVNCFGSIYTHSLEWATRGKSVAKGRIGRQKKSQIFEDKYDRLMCSMNWGETNGILVGPECSRVFSEVLLSAIDRRIYNRLGGLSLVEGNHYTIRRYIDDYLVFSNSHDTLDTIKEVIEQELAPFGLKLNPEKEIHLSRPYTRSKYVSANRVAQELRNVSKAEEYETCFAPHVPGVARATVLSRMGLQRKWIQDQVNVFRELTSIYGADTERAVSASMKALHRNVLRSKIVAMTDIGRCEYLFSVVEVAIKILLIAPSVSSTMKLCSLLLIVSDYFDSITLDGKAYRHSIGDHIRIAIKTMIERKGAEITQVGALNMLLTLTAYEDEPELAAEVLRGLVAPDQVQGQVCSLRYFEIVTILYYVRDHAKYASFIEEIVLKAIQDIMVDYTSANGDGTVLSCEYYMFVIDALRCPYIPQYLKVRLYNATINRTKSPLSEVGGQFPIPAYGFVDWQATVDMSALFKEKQWHEVY